MWVTTWENVTAVFLHQQGLLFRIRWRVTDHYACTWSSGYPFWTTRRVVGGISWKAIISRTHITHWYVHPTRSASNEQPGYCVEQRRSGPALSEALHGNNTTSIWRCIDSVGPGVTGLERGPACTIAILGCRVASCRSIHTDCWLPIAQESGRSCYQPAQVYHFWKEKENGFSVVVQALIHYWFSCEVGMQMNWVRFGWVDVRWHPRSMQPLHKHLKVANFAKSNWLFDIDDSDSTNAQNIRSRISIYYYLPSELQLSKYRSLNPQHTQ